MTNKIKNLPASVLGRLRQVARSEGRTFQEILTFYGFERLLYRLAKSPYRDRFVLKGALAMMTWPSGATRTTRDIDFRAYIGGNVAEAEKILREICNAEVEPDGIRFDPDSIVLDAIIERADNPGLRAKLVGFIGKVEIPLQLDMGFSDAIFPEPVSAEFPTILRFDAPVVRAYRPETVLSEKI